MTSTYIDMSHIVAAAAASLSATSPSSSSCGPIPRNQFPHPTMPTICIGNPVHDSASLAWPSPSACARRSGSSVFAARKPALPTRSSMIPVPAVPHHHKTSHIIKARIQFHSAAAAPSSILPLPSCLTCTLFLLPCYSYPTSREIHILQRIHSEPRQSRAQGADLAPMCWVSVKDEEEYYRVPTRTRRVKRVVRNYSPSPPPIRRVSRTYVRRLSPPSGPPMVSYPPPPPSVHPPSAAPPPPSPSRPATEAPPPSKAPSKAPSAVPDPPPAPPSQATSKAPSAAPDPPPAPPSKAASKAPSAAPDPPPAPPSKAASKAPSAAPDPPPPASKASSRKASVAPDPPPSVSKASKPPSAAPPKSSPSSSSSDVRSRKTSGTTHRSSKSSAPPTEYSMHEREREVRRYSRPRDTPPEWETYRYVEAPPPPFRSHSRSVSRRSGSPRRSSVDSHGKVRDRIAITDGFGKTTIDWKR